MGRVRGVAILLGNPKADMLVVLSAHPPRLPELLTQEPQYSKLDEVIDTEEATPAEFTLARV